MSPAAVNPGRRRARAPLVVAALGVCVAALGGIRAWRSARSGASAGAVGPFRVGDDVRSHVRVTVRLDLGRGAPPQEMELQGEWRATVTDVDGGLAISACELGNLRAAAREGSGDSAREAGAGDELVRELGRRFFVSQRADGAVYEVWLPRGMKPAMANILLTVVGEAQLVRPAQPQPAWIIQERDLNGAYLAAYQETAPGHFHKQKARYLDVHAQPAAAGTGASAQPLVRIDRSDVDLIADTGGRLLELRADEVTTIELAGLSFKVDLHVALEGGRVSAAPALAGTFGRERDQVEAHPMAQLGLDPAAEVARRDRALLSGATADNLLVELRALPAGDTRAASTLEARWEALLRLEPATSARIPALVRGEPEDRGKVLVDAVATAGTEDAQAALVAVAADAAASAKLRLYAIQYLGVQGAPGPAAIAGLRARAEDPDHGRAQAALLALGACARTLRPRAPDRARALVGELNARLRKTGDPQARQDLVAALGNAGDPSSLPLLREFIGGKDDAIRLPAIEALRFIDDPTVDPLLQSLLARTADGSARFAALSAIRYRDVGPYTAALAAVARHDSLQGVRRAAIDLLGSHLTELPTLRALLEELAQQSPDKATRDLAARYLGNG